MMKRKKICNLALCRSCTGLIVCILLIVFTGCPQPVEDVKVKSKPQNGSHSGSSLVGDTGTGTPSGESSAVSGEITYAGLPIPQSLSKIPISLKTTASVLSKIGSEKTVKYDIEAALYENFLLDPEKASAIYPGAVLVGDSIDDGTYREIWQGNKRDALYSFSLQGVKGKGGKPGKVSDSFSANLSRYRDFHNEVLSQKIDYTASISSSYDERRITSEDDFKVKCKLGVGFGLSKLKAKLSAGLTFNSGDDKEVHLIRFVETFYTCDMTPGNTSLMTDIPVKKLGATMPVYVSSVSYGRIAYLLIESEKKWSEIKPSLDIALKVKKQGVDAEVSAAIKKLEETTKTTIFTIGGGEHSATKLSEFSKSIAKDGFSSGNPGQVIKYKLKFLDDDSFAYIRYAGSYTVTEKIHAAGSGSADGISGSSGSGSGETNSENGGGTTEAQSRKLRVTAQLKCISAKLSGYNATSDISGTIDMCLLSDSSRKYSLFNYTHANPLSVKKNGTTVIDAAAVSFIVPDISQELSFTFNIKRAPLSFLSYPFITSESGTNYPIKCTVSDIEAKKKHRFKIYQKNDRKNQYLEFEVEFAVEHAG